MERINTWLTLVANLGVVAGIVFLAFEIQVNTDALEENRKLTRAETTRQVTLHWEEVTRRITQNRETASVFMRGNRNVGDLDEIDQLIYRDLISGFVTHQFTILQMARDGFVGLDFAEMTDQVVGEILRQHPGAQTWWQATKNGFPHRDYVDALIQRESQDQAWGFPIVQPVDD